MSEERDWNIERAEVAARAAGREVLIAKSFARITGGALLPDDGDPTTALWRFAAPVVAHGTEADPLFFYGNRAALALFEFPAAEFVRLPSRLSTEPAGRGARAELMARVARDNFVSDYSGVRVSASGKRFRIEGATVWNLLGTDGALHGQAATFSRWRRIESVNRD